MIYMIYDNDYIFVIDEDILCCSRVLIAAKIQHNQLHETVTFLCPALDEDANHINH